MSTPSAQTIARDAQQAGYQVVSSEQLRPNRWLLHVLDGEGHAALIMVQARPLVGSADVQDLSDLVRLRRVRYGVLLAHGGAFSPAAQRTLAELGDQRLRLCTALPPAGRADAEGRPVGAALKSPL